MTSHELDPRLHRFEFQRARETAGIHAGHLCYGILSQSSITLIDHKTGVMNLEIRQRRQPYLDRKQPLPADLDALLKKKQIVVPWKADADWHELALVTEGDEMRLSLDGKVIAHHRAEGFAHPMKRWFSFLTPSTVWIVDVKIWKIKQAPLRRNTRSSRCTPHIGTSPSCGSCRNAPRPMR